MYRAYQPAFRRTYAVKVLATLNPNDRGRERFDRECQAMGSLSEHPNIVTVYGAGFTPNGRPYLVMAYLPGGSLQERLDNQGPLPWQDATLCGVHLAALETTHPRRSCTRHQAGERADVHLRRCAADRLRHRPHLQWARRAAA